METISDWKGHPRCPYNGKIQYESKREARERYSKHAPDKRKWRVFRCHICDKYHVGHRREGARR